MIFKARLTEPLNIAGRTYPAGSIIELKIELVDRTTGLIDSIPEPIRVPRDVTPRPSAMDEPPLDFPGFTPPAGHSKPFTSPIILDMPEPHEITRRSLREARRRNQEFIANDLDPERIAARAKAMRDHLDSQTPDATFETGTS